MKLKNINADRFSAFLDIFAAIITHVLTFALIMLLVFAAVNPKNIGLTAACLIVYAAFFAAEIFAAERLPSITVIPEMLMVIKISVFTLAIISFVAAPYFHWLNVFNLHYIAQQLKLIRGVS